MGSNTWLRQCTGSSLCPEPLNRSRRAALEQQRTAILAWQPGPYGRGEPVDFGLLTRPTALQSKAFDLLGVCLAMWRESMHLPVSL